MSSNESFFLGGEDVENFVRAGFLLEANTEWLELKRGNYYDDDDVFILRVPRDAPIRNGATHIRYVRDTEKEDNWKLESFLVK